MPEKPSTICHINDAFLAARARAGEFKNSLTTIGGGEIIVREVIGGVAVSEEVFRMHGTNTGEVDRGALQS